MKAADVACKAGLAERYEFWQMSGGIRPPVRGPATSGNMPGLFGGARVNGWLDLKGVRVSLAMSLDKIRVEG